MPGPYLLDDDTRKLVVRLLTRAGMIMEDASVVAVLSAGGGGAPGGCRPVGKGQHRDRGTCDRSESIGV